LGNPKDLEKWILSAGKNGAELVKGLRVKDPFGNGISKQIDKFRFADDQMDAIVAAVAILAKAQGFPGIAIESEEVTLDPRFLLLVPMEGADGALFQGNHFGHDRETPTVFQ
jgi:hypothetical protein